MARRPAVRGTDPALMMNVGLRLVTFTVKKDSIDSSGRLDLPDDARLIAVIRDGSACIVKGEETLEPEDRVIILTTEEGHDTLGDRYRIGF